MSLDILIVAPSAAGLYQDLKADFSAKETNIWAGLLANAVRYEHSDRDWETIKISKLILYLTFFVN